MSKTVQIVVDDNTADLLDVAERAIGVLREIVDARYAGELLDYVARARTELENEPLEDARLACRAVADAWNIAAAEQVPVPVPASSFDELRRRLSADNPAHGATYIDMEKGELVHPADIEPQSLRVVQ